MNPTYEIQTQERDGVYGYVVTTSSGRDSWTCPWIAVPDAKSHADAAKAARAAEAAMQATLRAI